MSFSANIIAILLFPLLYSSKYKFVFIKTRKTASSSAELILQKLCIPPDLAIGDSNALGTTMLSSDYGIVGARWHLSQKNKPNESMYWSHMPAREIYQKMPALFEGSLKLSCCRHPVTKYISAFHHFGGYSRRDALQLKQENRLDILRKDFSDYVNNVNLSERSILALRGKCCVDDFIRQESFEACMERVLARIGVENPQRLNMIKSAPSAKMSVKTSLQDNKPYVSLVTHDYLDMDILKKISSWMEWDCEVMGYEISAY